VRPYAGRIEPARRPTPALLAALVAAAFGVVLGVTGCSDLLDTNADAVIQLEAEDQDQVLLTRQEVLASASTWGGTRVGEQTTQPNESALEFSLPGENLEMALGAISELDARVVSRTIDVDPAQVDRTPPTTTERDQDPPDPAERQVRLRVEVTEASPGGAGALVQLVMAVFSVVGMVATAGWVMRWWRARRPGTEPPRRNIDRVDLRDDPPTQETPRVPPQW
jgi:uncharacterized iron-regulated membrane protein